MKQRIIIYLASILLIPAFLFASLVPDRTSASMIQTSRKTIVQTQLSLEESLNDLSKIFGVKIEIAGKSEKIPGKFNLNLKQATLERSVKEAIRKAGIQNHALVWDKTGKTLRILIFEAGKNDNRNGNRETSDLFSEDATPLTQEELYLLAEQSAVIEAEIAESMEPLTQEQLKLLEKESVELEAKIKEREKPLTPEQMKLLEEQDTELEAKIKESEKPLTPEQMQILESQSAELKKEIKNSEQPLTEEQMLLLKDEANQP